MKRAVVLSVLGLRMIHAGLTDGGAADTAPAPAGRGGGLALLAAALATSVDAAAAGVTLPMFGVPVAQAALVIGCVTALLSALAVLGGAAAGALMGRGAGVLGGLILVGIGAQILVEHLGLLGG